MPEADLYDDLIMEHIRNARNYRVPKRAQFQVTGSNPLCGDEITLYLGLRADRLEDIAFQCTCCGISMASASIMTELLMGRDLAEAKMGAQGFVARLDGRARPGPASLTREQEAILATARKFPSRARCAALPWSTLAGALDEPARAPRVP
jgi:nitrogen fixation protein NifU and related proteins